MKSCSVTIRESAATPLKIEWIGLVVIGLYCAIYGLTFMRRDKLMTPAIEQAAQND